MLPARKSSPVRLNGISHLSHPVCELADEVMRINARMKVLFADATAKAGMSAFAYAIFGYIAEAPTPPTVPQIGRSLGHARQVIQRAVNELVAAGLVESIENPNHKRAVLLRLSPSGERFKRTSDDRAIEISDDLLRTMDEEICRQAVLQLRAMRGELEDYLRQKGDRIEFRATADFAAFD